MKVSILVFPGVEELDFAGFFEVLAVANRVVEKRWFETEFLGTSKGKIVCGGGLKIVPDKVLGPRWDGDLIFVPGGGYSRGDGVDLLLNDQKVLTLLRTAEREGKMVWSVCTGALVLGRAGLLKGRWAVTHHSFLDRLEGFGAKVATGRTVLDGKIMTAGGISSSIDVGLELVRQSLGDAVVAEVRTRMEYHSPERR
jgi:cyclohexyl-isocyanide hydratase